MKKACESYDLQALPRFLGVFEKIEKLSFRLLLPFWWGEQDSNFKLETAVNATFIYVLNLCAPILHQIQFLLFQY
ncbi:hypothetical protein K6T82_03680 [Flavobacterium sp. 17A]|uniref:Uncharacterized protein n=1 Tax=Flavobacterium potami TaxID=2872310 RepID=A0A9X1H7K2_9FLAO|nr:hypothetical protein [Flavobacterium potami]MBZ4033851.1 hypothetical protein [Flavobacterium potami]